MVDTVVYIDDELYGIYRVLKVTKNRFGSTNEVAFLEMKQNGLHCIEAPEEAYLQHLIPQIGTSLSYEHEGSKSTI